MPDTYDDANVTSETPPKQASGPTEDRQTVPFPDRTKGTRWQGSATGKGQ